MDFDAVVARLGRLATRRALLDAGLSYEAIRRRVGRGLLHEIHPGVFAVGTADLDHRTRLRAAVLAEPGGALSCHTCLEAHRLIEPADGFPHVTTPKRGLSSPEGLVVHRVRRAPPLIHTRDGIRTTSLPEAFLACAQHQHPQLQRAINEALYRRLVPIGAIERIAATRRPGALLLRDTLRYAAATHSDLEDRFYALLVGAGLPLPIANARVGPYRVDFLWPEHRLIVETDGWAAHGHELAHRSDASKKSLLEALGHVVLRVPARRVTHEPLALVADLARRLEFRSPAGVAQSVRAAES